MDQQIGRQSGLPAESAAWLIPSACRPDLIESCVTCASRSDHSFCNLSKATLQLLEDITCPAMHPKDALLFEEGSGPDGIFIVCKGQVALTTFSGNGKRVTLKVAGEGDVLGLSATISGRPYEAMANALTDCQVNFVSRLEFLRLMRTQNDICRNVVRQLGADCVNARRESGRQSLAQVVSTGASCSLSTAGNLAKFLWESYRRAGQFASHPVELGMSHEEIARILGRSRKTVACAFVELERRGVIQVLRTKGSTFVIRDLSLLLQIARRSSSRTSS